MLIYSLYVSIYLIPNLNFYNLNPHSLILFHMIMYASLTNEGNMFLESLVRIPIVSFQATML